MEIDPIFFQQINPTVAVRILCEVGGVADSTLTTLKGSAEVVDSTFPTPSTEYHIPAMSLDRVVTMIGSISNPEEFKRTLGRLSFQTLANLDEDGVRWLVSDEICLVPFSVPSTVYNSEGFQENIEDLGAILRNEAGAGDLDDRIIISGEVGGGDSNGKEKSKNRWILPAAVAVLGIGGFLWWRKSQS